MPSNSTLKGGRYSYASKDKQMEAFDRLPRSIRVALANAAFAWAPYPLWRRYENSGKPASYWVAQIAKWDTDQIAKDRTRVWRFDDDKPRTHKDRQHAAH
jgi:hypothetical protein